MGRIETAVLSVFDKTWISTLGRFLAKEGVALYSSGGTLGELRSKRVPANALEKLTGGKEILDGRVKTLHYNLYAGLLADRENKKHMRTLESQGIRPIDLVVVNFYPFREEVKASTEMAEAQELIDIGGVTLARAAAKNFPQVLVLVDPDDYKPLIQQWKEQNGDIPYEIRLKYAKKAFAYCRAYDEAIENYFSYSAIKRAKKAGKAEPEVLELEGHMELTFSRARNLRYGENPHQRGALYTVSQGLSVPFKVTGGKGMSYNNFQDAAGAFRLCRMPYEKPFVACVVKHINPCGAAIDDDPVRAIQRAKEGDPISAYGGVLGVRFEVDVPEANEIAKTYLEVIVAPKFSPEALRVLSAKKKLRLVEIGKGALEQERERVIAVNEGMAEIPLHFTRTPFGFLVQEEDLKLPKPHEIEVVSDVPLRPQYKPDLMFGLSVIRFLKSNSVALFKDLMMIGAGAGQPSRVDATRIATEKAGRRAAGSLLVSDAFFPFADSVEVAHKAGVSVLVAPSGSIRDHEVIDRANALKLCMVFVADRHFLH